VLDVLGGCSGGEWFSRSRNVVVDVGGCERIRETDVEDEYRDNVALYQ